MKPSKLLFTPDFNQSIHIEADTQNHTTSDAGAISIRSILDKTTLATNVGGCLHKHEYKTLIIDTDRKGLHWNGSNLNLTVLPIFRWLSVLTSLCCIKNCL